MFHICLGVGQTLGVDVIGVFIYGRRIELLVYWWPGNLIRTFDDRL